MAIISAEEIIKLARISNIAIHDDEIDMLTKQIEAVLNYAARVQEIAAHQEGLSTRNINVFREDVVIRTNPEQIIAQAPAREARYFVVPAILEHK